MTSPRAASAILAVPALASATACGATYPDMCYLFRSRSKNLRMSRPASRAPSARAATRPWNRLWPPRSKKPPCPMPAAFRSHSEASSVPTLRALAVLSSRRSPRRLGLHRGRGGECDDLATSSTSWADDVTRRSEFTTSRGRSAVPDTFLRTRMMAALAADGSFAARAQASGRKCTSSSLLARLSGLATDDFASRSERPYPCRAPACAILRMFAADFADQSACRFRPPRSGIGALNGEGDAVGGLDGDRVAVTRERTPGR